MNGNPVGVDNNSSRGPVENKSMMQYPRPKIPLTETEPTIAKGTLRAIIRQVGLTVEEFIALL